MARPFVLSPAKVKIAASIGIAFSGRGNDAPERAPPRLPTWRCTERSAPRRHHTPGISDLRELHLAEHHSGLAQALPGAVERDELHLEYQPIVDDRRAAGSTGVEALLRWTHPTRGPVSRRPCSSRSPSSPARSSRSGDGCSNRPGSDRQHWQALASGQSRSSVNVSARQFMSAGLRGHASPPCSARHHADPDC